VTNQPSALEQLAVYVSGECRIDPSTLLAELGQSTPTFLNNHFMDVPLRTAWDQLSMDARLLAYVWMQERSAEDTRRGEASL
jgi:hypothetical protein